MTETENKKLSKPGVKIFTCNDPDLLETHINDFINRKSISEIVSMELSHFGAKEHIYYCIVMTYRNGL